MTGERLGVIGRQDEDLTPDWKSMLLSKPSVSTRRGIAWGFRPPYEDTSTLVLTSNGNDFVDVRFSLRGDATSGDAFWAFAGTSTTTFPSDPPTSPTSGGSHRKGGALEIPCMAHCVWKHEIDNKGADINDEGDLFLLDNGECVEVGMMENKKSGRVEMYKEYWTSVETDPGSPCVVARTEHRTGQEKGRGMVIRIGNHCQAIFQRRSTSGEESQRRGEVHVERWARRDGKWVKDWRSSTGEEEEEDVVMPSKWVCEEVRKLGEGIELLGRRWEVTEAT